ncbi:hypothetical protein ACE1B6_06570 [Aerosakkonemataceae cyanobacterium BLCC-F154]|uniref:Uncharacterized protein n=1 Tax=Floridaenema fluviatile BLCC-F154 TaxID=3153640 RepID=A0ABV4Y7Y9_9CYAN
MEFLAYIYMTLAQKPELEKTASVRDSEKKESQQNLQYVAFGL